MLCLRCRFYSEAMPTERLRPPEKESLWLSPQLQTGPHKCLSASKDRLDLSFAEH